MKINLKMMITVRIHHAWVLDQTDRWVRSDHITWRSQIGRSKLFLDRSEIGSVQVQSPVGPVRLHLKKCRSYALERTGPRPNRGCPSLSAIVFCAAECSRCKFLNSSVFSKSLSSGKSLGYGLSLLRLTESIFPFYN